MAHFAEVNDNNEVLRVLVVPNEFENDGQNYLSNIIGLGGKWIQTSYNANFRGKFAGIGDIYLEDEDVFISKQPYPSWVRDGLGWKPPKPIPDGNVEWDENLLDWVEIG